MISCIQSCLFFFFPKIRCVSSLIPVWYGRDNCSLVHQFHGLNVVSELSPPWKIPDFGGKSIFSWSWQLHVTSTKWLLCFCLFFCEQQSATESQASQKVIARQWDIRYYMTIKCHHVGRAYCSHPHCNGQSPFSISSTLDYCFFLLFSDHHHQKQHQWSSIQMFSWQVTSCDCVSG